MSYRLRNMLIAVALAGLAALLVTYYVSNYKNSVRKNEASVPVLVASKDIPAGTLGSDVAKGYLKTIDIARKAVVPGAISSPTQIRSLVALQTTFAGEQITTHRFGPLVEQGIKGQLTANYRAMQLAGDPNQVLSGTIKAGDHVDFVGVVTTQGSNGGSGLTFGRVFVRNIQVLQTQTESSSSGKIGGGGNNDEAVLLRVTDAQAQKIAVVYKKGDYWALLQRPGLKSSDSPNSVETPASLFADGINRSVLAGLLRAANGGGN
jgi:Flp pilus assembly protein CpaB